MHAQTQNPRPNDSLHIGEFELVKTCGGCPEQYDVYLGTREVGYLRLRHGYFRVDYPTCGGATIYEAYPQGDGNFTEDERMPYLCAAVAAIAARLSAPSVQGEV